MTQDYETGYREGQSNVMADFSIPMEELDIEYGENETVADIVYKVHFHARSQALREAEEALPKGGMKRR